MSKTLDAMIDTICNMEKLEMDSQSDESHAVQESEAVLTAPPVSPVQPSCSTAAISPLLPSCSGLPVSSTPLKIIMPQIVPVLYPCGICCCHCRATCNAVMNLTVLQRHSTVL